MEIKNQIISIIFISLIYLSCWSTASASGLLSETHRGETNLCPHNFITPKTQNTHQARTEKKNKTTMEANRAKIKNSINTILSAKHSIQPLNLKEPDESLLSKTSDQSPMERSTRKQKDKNSNYLVKSKVSHSDGLGWHSNEFNPLFEFNMTVGIPHGDFSHNTHAVGLGMKAAYFHPFSTKAPIYLGFSGGGMLLGSHSQHLHRDIEISVGNTIIDRIPVDLDVKTNNSIWNGFLHLRFLVPISLIKCYADAIVGFNYLQTNTTIYDRTFDGWLSNRSDQIISSSSQANSFVFAYGAEAGFIIPLNDKAAIKMGLNYVWGHEAEYYDETQINQWEVSFDGSTGSFNPSDLDGEDFNINQNAVPRKSTTNLFIFSIGFSVNLSNK